VSLLLIDEVHHLSDRGRGGALEAVVARMMVSSDDLSLDPNPAMRCLPAVTLRIVAVSATVPNVTEVSGWLRTHPSACKTFSESYRPIPLEHHVLGYRPKNAWTFGTDLDNRLFDVVEKYSDGRPAIVFCPSRKACQAAAQTYVSMLHSKGPASSINRGNLLTFSLSVRSRTVLSDVAANCIDKANRGLIAHGVAVHHGDISPEDRSLVEGLFKERVLRLLFTTTTLSQGVNLPARLVIVKGTSVYSNGSMQEYDRNLLVQMLGRAGRPQFDTRVCTVQFVPAPAADLMLSISRASLS
jgi:ATP-dependent DNA helicase HFM1/MER3